MKTSILLAVFAIVALSSFLLWHQFDQKDHGVSISVTENDEYYQFSALFDRGSTRMVDGYINKCIKPNSLAKSENDEIDADTSLPDHTNFHVIESAGKLEIKLDKKKNTTASYERIKGMCNGIKNLLAGK